MSKPREISCDLISKTVKDLFVEANLCLGADVIASVEEALHSEDSPLGQEALAIILDNARIAREERMPLCQDTGLAVLFLEVGQDVHIVGGSLYDALQEGVRAAYRDGFLRKSVCDPLSRKNTGDNTPAVIYTEIVEGDRIRIVAMPKGGGSENMSGTVMLMPSQGVEGIREYVIAKVADAGPNPCPPVIVGVGIGGSIEQSGLLAKKALMRSVGAPNGRDDRLSQLEREILEEVNRLGIGPQGYGGNTTALAVHIEMMPCHIASLPVTVNIQCHVARHREKVL